jgi:hypothetical protein
MGGGEAGISQRRNGNEHAVQAVHLQSGNGSRSR